MFAVFFLVGSFIIIFNITPASGLTANSWTTKTSMNQARWGLGVVEAEGEIYAIGGCATNGYVAANERYDPMSDTWTLLTSMPTARSNFAIAAYQGKIYCIGGETRAETGIRTVLGLNEVYDTVTDSWSTKESLPTSGTNIHAGTVNGKIYVIVNHDVSTFNYSQDLYMYDPATDVWTKKASIPDISSPGDFNTLTVVGDKIIVTGDHNYDSALNARSDYKVMIYDTKLDQWYVGTSGSKVAHLGDVGATKGVNAPQKIYIIGLTSGNDPFVVTNRVYDPTSDTWSTAKEMATMRKGFGIAVVDDIIYVIGGYTSEDLSLFTTTITPSALTEQYIPLGYGGSSDGPVTPSFSPYLIAAVVVIIIAVAAVTLYFYSAKEKKTKTT